MAEPGRKIAVFEGAMAAAAAASDERMQQPWPMGEAVAAEKSPVLKLQESREMADDFGTLANEPASPAMGTSLFERRPWD